MKKQNYTYILDSNKYILEEKRMFFVGILTKTLLDTTLFKSNENIKEYTNIYQNIFVNSQYKDYLYNSRTLLISRMIRDFMSIKDSFYIEECFNVHKNFLENKESISDIKTKKNKINTEYKTNLLEDMINTRGKLND